MTQARDRYVRLEASRDLAKIEAEIAELGTMVA